MKIRIGARKSPLSIAQVKEIYHELLKFAPEVEFGLKTYDTPGDRDLITSLKPLEKTNFFTHDIDEAVLSTEVDIGIHSAKDLPEPLDPNLEIYAITQGVDTRDSLVMYPPYTLKTLPQKSRIGVSSVRREEFLKEIRPDFQFIDIRGNIQQRLDLLKVKKVDAIVIAEAALIRLGLTDINRTILSCDTAPLQGKLAIVGKKGNEQLIKLFKYIDIR